MYSKEDTKLKFGDSEFCLHCRKGGTEVLAEEIIKDVGNHEDDECPPLPILVLFSQFSVHKQVIVNLSCKSMQKHGVSQNIVSIFVCRNK